MRRNPLDIVDQPKGRVALGIAGAATIILAAAGMITSARTSDQRVENIRAAVMAKGYGEAAVTPIKGDECWRAREGFTWKTATASGSACAGPGARVYLFPGQPRPSLSGVAQLQDGGSPNDPL